MYNEQMKKIKSKKVIVGVIGLGYVGLPLIVSFSKKGLETIGYDVNEEKFRLLKKTKSYIGDISDSDLKKIKDLFTPTTKLELLNKADAILICVPTPLRKTKEPDIKYILSALEIIKKIDYKGKLIVLESTTYPGTTEEILLPELENKGKYKVGKDFFLAFSPERVDPGNKTYQIKNTPKVIGGVTAKGTNLTKALYSIAIDKVIPVSSTRVAESIKLLENIYRSVNIGLINEMAQLCHKMNINIWEVIEAAATKPYGFMPFYPGPGLGGHCIPLDPYYLSWKAKAYNFNTRFIELAGEVNGSMPDFVVQIAGDLLNKRKKSINGSKIFILGVAYKKDISDIRESPALDIIRSLEEKGAKVYYHDPHIPSFKIGQKIYISSKYNEKTISKMDMVIIVTDHSNVDYAKLFKSNIPIFDTRNGLKGIKNKNIYKF
jgi:UDP-N-acetyl-D-glucosamine dehydrogenase